jgi:hypothetical protein
MGSPLSQVHSLQLDVIINIMVKKHWLKIILFIISVYFINLHLNYGFIELQISGENSDIEKNIHFVDIYGEIIHSHSTSEETVKIRLRKGLVEIEINNDSSSGFASVLVGGLSKTSNVEIVLEKESSREFVGDNPSPCAFYSGVLVSYQCSNYLNKAYLHKAASKDTPSFTEKIYISEDLTFKESIVINGRVLVFTRNVKERNITVFELSSEGKLLIIGSLKNIESISDKGVHLYGKGFLVTDYSDNIYYYESVSAEPELISLNKEFSAGLTPYALSSFEGSIIFAAYNEAVDSDSIEEGSVVRDEISELAIINGGNTDIVKLEKTYGTIVFCGSELICAVDYNGMDIISILDNKPKVTNSFKGIVDVVFSEGLIHATKLDSVLTIDPSSGVGYASFSSKNVSICGIKDNVGGYQLCVIINSKNRKMLHVPIGTALVIRIEDVLSSLLSDPSIKSASIYKSRVFISPDYGDYLYDKEYQPYIDPIKKQQTDSLIKKSINSFNILENGYTVTPDF